MSNVAMASATLAPVTGWLVGETISVYVRDVRNVATGSAVTTAAVGSNSTVTFSGLTAETRYIATDGTHEVRFGTHTDSSTSTSSGSSNVFIQEDRPAESTAAWVWYEVDADGTPTGTVEVYSPDPSVPTIAPANTVAPAISGTTETGQTLSCSNGTWSNSPTSYTRQWKRDGSDIAAATGSTYVLQSADVGHSVKCTVTATNVVGSTPADSNTVTPTAPSAPTNSVAPAITGTTTTGQTLTCDTGTWANSPTSYTYQWKRNGSNISSATNSTYVLQVADEGTSVKCAVTATNAGGSASADSNTVSPTAPASFTASDYGTVRAHFKADAGTSSTVDGTGLSQWDDQSANVRHLLQATSGNRPVYKTSIVNSLPVVRFDGTDDWMKTAVAGSAWHTATTLTLFMVRVRRAYTNGAGMLILTNNVDAEYQVTDNLWMGADTASGSTGDWRNGLNIGVRTHPGNNVAFLETLKFDGTDEVAYNNGTAVKTDGSTGAFGFKALVLAARYGGDQTPASPFEQMDVCEILIYAEALNDTNRQAVEAYLKTKWGIS